MMARGMRDTGVAVGKIFHAEAQRGGGAEREMRDSGVDWIGKIPEGWEVMRLKSIFEYRKGLSITKADLTPTGIPVISYGQIHSRENTGTHLQDSLLRFVPMKYLESDSDCLLQEDDFVFADTSEDLEGLGNCAYVDRENKIFAGYHTIVFRPNATQRGRQFFCYLAYLFKTDIWRSQFRAKALGIKVYSLSQRLLNDCSLILPPLAEQKAIAAYLDEKCAAIDAAVTEAKKGIEEYKSWKKSLIFEAVTGKRCVGAFNAETQSRRDAEKMKPSGIPWIGAIPEGWRVSRVKNIANIQHGQDPKTEGSIPVYGSGDRSFKTCGEYKDGPAVLLGRKGATLHIPHYIVGRYWNVDTAFDVKMLGDANLRWFYYLAICFDYKAYMSQTTLPSMTQSDYRNMTIPIPEVSEQQAIADYLDKKCAAIDALVAEKEALIADLEAYKKSLIYETVTGKREVA